MNQVHQSLIQVTTPGRGISDITSTIATWVAQSGISIGTCHVFLHHTSASLILCENADPLVQRDLEAFMQRLVKDGDPLFQHTAEGPDDMPAHIRTILTQSYLVLPITDGQLGLGTWQGIYLWEHRIHSHQRQLTLTLQGE